MSRKKCTPTSHRSPSRGYLWAAKKKLRKSLSKNRRSGLASSRCFPALPSSNWISFFPERPQALLYVVLESARVFFSLCFVLFCLGAGVLSLLFSSRRMVSFFGRCHGLNLFPKKGYLKASWPLVPQSVPRLVWGVSLQI